MGILIFKGLTVRLLYKSFGVKGLTGCIYIRKYWDKSSLGVIGILFWLLPVGTGKHCGG
jgi:hypothetical protein